MAQNDNLYFLGFTRIDNKGVCLLCDRNIIVNTKRVLLVLLINDLINNFNVFAVNILLQSCNAISSSQSPNKFDNAVSLT